MVSLVEEMLDHHKRLANAQVNSKPNEQGVATPCSPSRLEQIIRKQIEITDKKIDKLVYVLYGLTEDEIEIVEGEK